MNDVFSGHWREMWEQYYYGTRSLSPAPGDYWNSEIWLDWFRKRLEDGRTCYGERFTLVGLSEIRRLALLRELDRAYPQ